MLSTERSPATEEGGRRRGEVSGGRPCRVGDAGREEARGMDDAVTGRDMGGPRRVVVVALVARRVEEETVKAGPLLRGRS